MTTATPAKRRGRPAGPLVVYRLPTDERYAYLRAFPTGTRVRVTVNGLRDTKAELVDYDPEDPAGVRLAGRVRFTARVLTTAVTNVGTVDHVLVVQAETRGGTYSVPIAISGATVETVERAA